ncbi:tail tubular protein A [uncultured Caudovirales phage]|jgi:hypothetical protein|uniref:Tail tubular protein A n=1 Tax=uncultured Caudovirales phage TaxID=2100421 RepID=A0A6J5M121_9CAUD|nr:tail tubular protein A [uncultured Caudovirales phage]
MPLAPTTKLQAVNTMLSTIGSAPVNTITGANSADVALAVQILDETSLAVQSEGWHWNTDRDVPFTPDQATKYITVPANAIMVDVDSPNNLKVDVILRGQLLYDLKTRSHVFEEAVKATVVYALDWDFIPQAARYYINIKASRIFQDRMVGSEKHHTFTLRDEIMALSKLREYEGETADRTIFDNYDTFRVIARHYPQDFMG